MFMVAALLSVGCGGGDVTCQNAGNGGSTFMWSSCSDARDRQIACDMIPGSTPLRYRCTCTKAGIVGRTFETVDTSVLASPTAVSVANEQCGWHLAAR